MSGRPSRRQRGMVVVELAIVLGVAVLFFGILLMGGRLMWHYTVLQRAAFDAARYLATMPRPELGNPALAPSLAAQAEQLALAAVSEAGLDTRPGAGQISVRCDNLPCGGAVPQVVSVTLQIQLGDPFFQITGGQPLVLSSTSVQPYVN